MLDYTPRRTLNLYAVAMIERNAELRQVLIVTAAAAQGDEQMIKDALEDLGD